MADGEARGAELKPQSKPWPTVPILTPEEVYGGLPEQAREYPSFLESIVHWKDARKKPEALSPVRVLDCSHTMIIGHWCASLLAELGAEVIQVEPPGGDPLRKLVPFGRKHYYFHDRERQEPVGPHFLHEARNKLSVTLNLETEEGRELLKGLAVHADVLIENFPPGQFDAWGIGYRQLSEINPRLVYAWVGQRGQWGPLKDKPGMLDPTAQAACGFVHGTGIPREQGGRPNRSAMWMADHVGGTTAAMGILGALLFRDKVSGRGQLIEATAAEAIIRILDYNWAWYGMDGSIRPRYGNWDLAINIYAVNPCKDGLMMVGGGHDRLWYRIWKTVGKDRPDLEDDILDDKKLRLVTDRLPHEAQVKTYTNLTEWLKTKSRAEAERGLLAEEVASGGVTYIDEVAEYPHFKYRGHVREIDDNLYGKVLHAGSPFKGEKTPGRVKWLGRPVGYDNEDVYRRLLGFTKDDLRRLRADGVIERAGVEKKVRRQVSVESSDFEEWCRGEFNPAEAFAKPEALKGYRVLSCTQYILGPSCAAYLGELGAEVIKIEQPRVGEPMRHTTPWNEPSLYPLSRWVPERGTGLGFFGANYNEYFVGLDFHRPEAKEIMYSLAAKADVVIENYRPGTFDRWGIGYRQLREVNPRLVYAWLGGFGGWGPGRVRASYDILGQAQGGAFGITGLQEEFGGFPAKHTIWLADYWGGMMQAVHILAALYWRDTVSGEGAFLEYSQVDGVTRQLEWSLPVYGRHGIVRQRWGNWDTELCVHGIIRCGKSSYPDSPNSQEAEEGYILVSAYTDEDFGRLCRAVARQDLAGKYPDLASRVPPDGQREIYAALEAWAENKTKEDVARILDENDVLNQPVWNAKEVAEHPHWRERGSIFWLDDPTFGDVLAQAPGYKMSETPPRLKWSLKPAGADNEYIYSKLAGLSGEEIRQLEEEEVI